jgi:hypothetical protein
MSPTGNDSNNGLTPTTAWATPNHPVVCGDVIIAATGTYTGNQYGTPLSYGSGTVSNCPSTSGGIDGTGGIYFAILLCATPLQCNVVGATNSNGTAEVQFLTSNWAAEGFVVNGQNNKAGCFNAWTYGASVIHHDAFINDICYNAGAGFNIGGQATGNDQSAMVGVVAYNAAQTEGVCSSGISVIPENGPDTSSGTHIFIAGAFMYDNIDGICDADGSGSATTASASAASGASSISVASVSHWAVDMPIADTGSAWYNNANTNAIPFGTYITSITGSGPYTVGLSKNVGSGGVANGDTIVALTVSDGEGIILYPWDNYSYQGVVEQSVLWGNGSTGLQVGCSPSQPCASTVYAFGNTIYGNEQDYKLDGGRDDLGTNNEMLFHVSNNLVQATVTQPFGSATNNTIGTGQPVNAANFSVPSNDTVSGNFFKSASGAICPQGYTCNSGNDALYYGGSPQAGNTYVAPGFANPGGLPSSAPNCTGYTNAVTCMNNAYSVYADMTPSASGTSGKGYLPPGPCTSDSYYPTWLKGIVYLQWNGSSITENSGLVTKPCGM